MLLSWLLVAISTIHFVTAEETAREGKQFVYSQTPLGYVNSPASYGYYPQYGYLQGSPNPFSPLRSPLSGYNTEFAHPLSYNPYAYPRWTIKVPSKPNIHITKPSISIKKPSISIDKTHKEITIKKPNIKKPNIKRPHININLDKKKHHHEIRKPSINLDKKKHEIRKPEIRKPEIRKPEIRKPEIRKPEIRKPEINKDKRHDKHDIRIKKKDHYSTNRIESGQNPTAAEIAAALEAAGIVIPASSVIVITGREPETDCIPDDEGRCLCPEGYEDDGQGMCREIDLLGREPCQQVGDVCLCPEGYEDDGTGNCVAGKQPSLTSVVPGQVPAQMAQAVGVGSAPQSIFEYGTIVGLVGKEPTSQHVCGTKEGRHQCVSQAQPCGQSVTGQSVCISPANLATGNPLATQGNNAFQVGLDQLTLQLTGREPSEASRDTRYYYWTYRIYYHVDDQEAGLWMGHIQVYYEYYEWTLGLYYYIDPSGDLVLVYYSVTPTDGYIAEVATWPGFVPYSWQTQRITNFKGIIPELDLRRDQ